MQHTAIVVFLLQSLGGTNVRNVKKKKKTCRGFNCPDLFYFIRRVQQCLALIHVVS